MEDMKKAKNSARRRSCMRRLNARLHIFGAASAGPCEKMTDGDCIDFMRQVACEMLEACIRAMGLLQNRRITDLTALLRCVISCSRTQVTLALTPKKLTGGHRICMRHETLETHIGEMDLRRPLLPASSTARCILKTSAASPCRPLEFFGSLDPRPSPRHSSYGFLRRGPVFGGGRRPSQPLPLQNCRWQGAVALSLERCHE